MSDNNLLSLKGKRILITGASSGIGRSCAKVLSGLDAQIILVGRNQERLTETHELLHGTGHVADAFDLNQIESIPRWLKDLSTQCGPIDGLVHSAGIVFTRPLRAMSMAEYDTLMNINLNSAMALAKGFRQKGVCNKPSGIIFMSSIAGMVGIAGLSAYTASKSALIGVTRSLAMELAREDIRVNCISPGYVETEMTESADRIFTPEQLDKLNSEHPLGIGKPEYVAHAVAFLLAESGRWITGTNLVVDGGRTCH